MHRTYHQYLATNASADLITTLNPDNQQIEDVVRGFKAGMALAQSLKPGDRFQGAIIEADAYAGIGIHQNANAWRGFVIGFSNNLPEVVVTNVDDILLEYR